MFVKLRYHYRMGRLLALCKRMNLTVLLDNKQTYKDPVFIVYGTHIQVGLFLHERQVRVYVHEDQSQPFVLAHVLVQLCRMFTVEVRGTYKSRVDNTTQPVRKLSVVKDVKNDTIYH